MVEKIRHNGNEFSISELSDIAKARLAKAQKIEEKILEKKKMIAVLNRAKISYIEELKKEILAVKAGFNFLD